ncbi:MAG TPA: antA/AntB antirepressor family protein [Azospirillum sp.]
MAATAPLVHSPSGERIGNVTFPAEFQEIASLCTATEVAIGGRMVVGIADHRDLHAGLDVGRDHSNWIRGRIAEYGFVEGRDYEVFAEPGENPSGGRPAKVYRLTLHMAKELAMVEGNDKGKLARRYFIWAEENAPRRARSVPRLPSPARTFRDHFGIARLIGFDHNQAALAANKATVKLTGADMLGAMEATHLLAPQQASHVTPTQIGVKLGAAGGKTLSAQAVNRLLTRYGYQTADAGSDARWKLTDKGAAYGVWVDAPKSNGGASVRQLRWVETVADALAAELAAAPDVAGRA